MAEFGIRSALPVLYFHGFIGSRLEPGAAELYDTNIIAFDRPGYGRTDLQRLPSLRTWGADVAEALVQLGVGQCMVVGVSTGAPYALAVAAALGPRVQRVILAGGIAGPEVLETAGGTALVAVAARAASQPDRPHPAPAGEPRPGDPTGPPAAWRWSWPASARRWSARACRLDVLHARLLHSFRTGNRRGLRGALADARLVAQPWDFSVADVKTEVELLHGADDAVVPPAHAHWYAAHLPRARLADGSGRAAPFDVLSQHRPHPGGVPRSWRIGRRRPSTGRPLRGSGLPASAGAAPP